jgi:predicted SAM-dependent methyltransferase
MEALWTELLGSFWSIPPDNRVDLTYQKHVLLSIAPDEAEKFTRDLGQWFRLLLRHGKKSISVTDIDCDGDNVYYQLRNNDDFSPQFPDRLVKPWSRIM